MEHAHHCPLCSWHRLAPSATILKPKCPRCGGVLRAVRADELERARREDADTPASSRRGDATAAVAVLLAGAWLLPLLGVDARDLVFAPAFVLCAFACRRAVAKAGTDASWTTLWAAVATAALLGATASALAVL